MSKHMFGPLNPALGGGRVFIEDGDGEDVAEMLFEHDQVKMRAYTSLFCAAPDLLEACRGLLDAIHDSMTHESQNHHREQIDAARAAVEKAEGETK